MGLRVGHGIEDHREVTVDVRRVGRTVVVGMLDVMGTDLEPAFRELYGVFQLGRAADGAAPDRADGAAHLDAGIGAFLMQRSASFQYWVSVVPELAKWCSGSVETIIRIRSGPYPFFFSSMADPRRARGS